MSIRTRDDILFLSTMGKARVWGGLHHDLVEGVTFGMCLNVQSSFPLEHHPLPQFSIWEVGGSQWNYCVIKIVSVYFL